MQRKKRKKKLQRQGSAFSEAAFSSDEHDEDDGYSSRRRRKRPRPQSRPGPVSERDWRAVLRLGRNLARKDGEKQDQPSEYGCQSCHLN